LQQLWTAKEIVNKAEILAAGYRNRHKPRRAARYETLASRYRAKVESLVT
jgi:hypothetical protein